MEVSTAVTPTAKSHHLASIFSLLPLPPLRNRGDKSYDSSRLATSSRRVPITFKYNKSSRQSIQEYKQLFSNVNLHPSATASYKDPFVRSRQAPPLPSSHNSSGPSRSLDCVSSVSVSHHKVHNSFHKQVIPHSQLTALWLLLW